jgi:hypothetical protein
VQSSNKKSRKQHKMCRKGAQEGKNRGIGEIIMPFVYSNSPNMAGFNIQIMGQRIDWVERRAVLCRPAEFFTSDQPYGRTPVRPNFSNKLKILI